MISVKNITKTFKNFEALKNLSIAMVNLIKHYSENKKYTKEVTIPCPCS